MIHGHFLRHSLRNACWFELRYELSWEWLIFPQQDPLLCVKPSGLRICLDRRGRGDEIKLCRQQNLKTVFSSLITVVLRNDYHTFRWENLKLKRNSRSVEKSHQERRRSEAWQYALGIFAIKKLSWENVWFEIWGTEWQFLNNRQTYTLVFLLSGKSTSCGFEIGAQIAQANL